MANEAFTKVPGVKFSTQDGVELIEVENPFAKALITTHGGSVLSFIPAGQQDLLWVSSQAVYDGSKAVRGGIPVCWPWFGKSAEEGLPAHGFVRNMTWQLDNVQQLDSGITCVGMSIASSEQTLQYWPHEFELYLCIEIGPKLILNLTTHNRNDHAIHITEALHTYFNVGNPESLQIDGLQLATHLDKLEIDAEPETQTKILDLAPPRDSVYLDQTGTVSILDKENSRKILIEKRNSHSSVVWNPGPETVKGFSDIDDDAWREFACVESGNVLDNAISVPAHSKHNLSVQYSIAKD